MTSKFAWLLRRITSQIWFRVSLYAFGAVVTALIARYGAHFVPKEIADRVGDGTARAILSIVASSMLAVATFSLAAMVQAYAAAANLATPRATQILIDDPFSQNVISTFLGAFVFSMVGIIALSLGYYDRAGEFVLVVAAALVIATVIGNLFGWLDHLANLVRLGETVKKIAMRTERALMTRAEAPRLGGIAPAEGSDLWNPVFPLDTGYVRHIDPYRLNKLAEKHEGHLRLNSMPGNLADPSTALVWTSWAPDEAAEKAVRSAYTLGHERSFEQDPRFCLQVMSEIASRALSPGVNDPGTAIGVIASQQRLLTLWHKAVGQKDAGEEPVCPRVMAPALDPLDLFEDSFGPLLRDAAGILEVGVRLQKSLATLAHLDRAQFRDAACALSARALEHSATALSVPSDQERLRALGERVGAADPI
jgi:uncharacterized membrane protein